MSTWTCPHCNRPQVASEANKWRSQVEIPIGATALGDMRILIDGARCLNARCGLPTVSVKLSRSFMQDIGNGALRRASVIIRDATLIPDAGAKPQPDYIPQAIRDDYFEACRIKELSPKSAATLARRCLQGMIHDFCSIHEGSLAKEIEKLRREVDGGTAPRGVTSESVDAIDHVRSIGNIGAHMEQDVDRVIPIDPDEAQVLIELIEMLFDEWYVAQHEIGTPREGCWHRAGKARASF